MFYRGVV